MEYYVNKVVIVDESFLAELRQISRTSLDEFTNPGLDTKVLSLPVKDPEELHDLVRFIEPSAIRPGNIVVKPAYADQFVPADSFSEDLVLRKYQLFSQLCITLGAKKVFVSNIEDVRLEESDSSSAGGGVAASAPFGELGANFKSTQSSLRDDFRKSIMEFKTEAQGGEPNLEEAEKLVCQFGLHKDALFTHIFETCKLKNNRLTRHELVLDFSKDLKKIFDSSIHAKIKAMSKFYEGKADFEKARKSVEKARTASKLSIIVEF